MSVLRRFFVPVTLAASTLLGILLYGPTFRASFAYDDIDYLNHAADVLAGRAPFWSVLFRPQGEHFVPVLRLLLTASAALFGTNATPLRLLVFASHVLAALFVALLARRLLKDDVAGLAAGLAYVLPCGFSSMWLWFPSGGCVPIGIAGVTLALAALVHEDVLGRRRAAAVAAAGCLLALLCDNSLVPLLSAPFFLSLVERRRAGDRRLVSGFELFLVALSAAALALTRVFYARLTGMTLHTEPVAALKRFLFLAAAAPFRFFFPGPSVVRPLGGTEAGAGAFPRMEAAFGIVIALLALAALGAVLTPATRRGALAALATLPAGLGFLALVGIARWSYPYDELFDGDRYFFPLLIPAALFVATAVAALRERLGSRAAPRGRAFAWAAVFVLAALGLETKLHRSAMLNRVPWEVYAAHGRRLGELERLAARLSDAARDLPADAPPLLVPDTNFHFADIHNERISTRFLLAISNRKKTPRLALARGPVGERDAAILNGVFDDWAREIGAKAPWFAIEKGELVDAHRRDVIDFLTSAESADVLGGFYAWEQPRRWMGRSGTVRLVMSSPSLRVEAACPLAALAAARPEIGAPVLDVTLEDEAGGNPVALGTIRVESGGRASYELVADAATFARHRGAPVRVTLTARSSWRPADVFPGSGDTRELSVEVFRIGFGR